MSKRCSAPASLFKTHRLDFHDVLSCVALCLFQLGLTPNAYTVVLSAPLILHHQVALPFLVSRFHFRFDPRQQRICTLHRFLVISEPKQQPRNAIHLDPPRRGGVFFFLFFLLLSSPSFFLVRFFLSTSQSSCAAFLSSSPSIFCIFSSILTAWTIDKRNALDPYRGTLVVESAF